MARPSHTTPDLCLIAPLHLGCFQANSLVLSPLQASSALLSWAQSPNPSAPTEQWKHCFSHLNFQWASDWNLSIWTLTYWREAWSPYIKLEQISNTIFMLTGEKGTPDTQMPVTHLTFEAKSQEEAVCALFEELGKFWGKHTRKYGLAREHTRANWAISIKKYNQRENSKLGCSPSWGKQDKIKQFGKPMIPSHSTLTSKNLQEQKCIFLGSGIAMKMISITWLNISALSDRVFK